ncbi:hypothetical protein EYZ11_012260 [Aspergillus tanneri]|uniref:Uncharacterized protein n=1 Tax=Aspergillus tanneri TaxID=1220188 RepID=A0A4S3J2T1_9EURO|nr:hypothetical protein EYZ11_012260 [Aspergillus tanneri]
MANQASARLMAEQRRLIEDYRIRFEGPLLSSQWPTRYHSSPQRVQRVRTLNRVHTLIRAAQDCRKSSLHEEQWRRSTEAHLLQHFDEDIECHSCKKPLWVAEFPALGEADTRALCFCNPFETIRGEVANESQPFVTRVGIPFVDPSVPSEIGVKKPDTVIGLRRCARIKDLLRKHESLPYSPYQEDRGILFPFLVLEAKSEIGGPGFHAVETQTAFPIRTLINLQKTLSERTGIERDPLVWFLAYQGDVWKVYGCIPESQETLQLIVDFIYYWALDIYKEEIISCLSSSGTRHHEYESPSITAGLNSVHDSDSFTYVNGSFIDGQNNSSSSIQIPVTDGDDTLNIKSTLSISSDDVTMGGTNPASGNILAPWATEGLLHDIRDTSVIRSADKVFFTFHHLMIPEATSDALLILTSIALMESPAETAKSLLNNFCIEHPVIVDNVFLYQMEEIWTGAPSQHDRCDCEPVLAFISFRSYFRPTDWQLVRSISCVTASIRAINTLGSIAFDGFDSIITESPTLTPYLTANVVQPLRTLFGMESAAAAAQALSLCLYQHKEGSIRCDWKQALEAGKYVDRVWKALDANTPIREVEQNNSNGWGANTEETFAVVLLSLPEVLLSCF